MGMDRSGSADHKAEESKVHRTGLVSTPFNSESVALMLEETEPGPRLENLGTGPLQVLVEVLACLFGLIRSYSEHFYCPPPTNLARVCTPRSDW